MGIKDEFYKLQRENPIEAAELLIDMFGDLVNVMSRDQEVIDSLVAGLVRQHRTLQQSTIRQMVNMMLEWGKMTKAYPSRYTDLRNEDAARFCQSLLGNEEFCYNGKACMRLV